MNKQDILGRHQMYFTENSLAELRPKDKPNVLREEGSKGFAIRTRFSNGITP